jgi:hypothetical protein
MDLRMEIANLRSLTPELNAVTDRAATLVLAVEHFLNEECQLAIPASVQCVLGDENNGRVRFGVQLEYSRWEGKFRLIVADFVKDDRDDEDISNRLPWANCTRDRKLATVDLIPHLLMRIGKTVQSTIKDAKKNADAVEQCLADLGIGLQGGDR